LTKPKALPVRAGLLTAVVCSVALLIPASCAKPAPTTFRLTILHTNDIHGQFTPIVKVDGADTTRIGGFAALSHYVREERAQAERLLLFDAGDVMTGNLICDMAYDGALGGGLMTMMNHIGYDGLVPGNHMFDHSLTNMRDLARVADFPFVCCNLDKEGEYATGNPYEIFVLDGLTVGVIGVTYHPMVGMVAEPNMEGFVSQDPVEAVTPIVAEIDPQTDVIILLSHVGNEEDHRIAKSVTGVDLIVGGHSHQRLDTLHREGNVLIAQAGSYCRDLGRVDLVITDDSVGEYESRLIPLHTEGIQPDTAVARMANEFETEIEREYGTVIGELKTPWEIRHGGECNVGNWLTDALRRRLGTDVAFLNTGGLRKNLRAGPVRKRDIMEMLPFDNWLVIFDCKGEQLLQIAAYNLGTGAEGAPMALQMSGLTFSYRRDETGATIVEAFVNGAPVDPERDYSVASIDYIVAYNSERYFGFEVSDFRLHSEKQTAAIIDEVSQAGPIDARIEMRARRLD
jgi:5'-nucleotidase/2',3'-cyclic-nucleotide 2'-phosphodiesterase/3'-nucleotidase